MGTGVGAYSSPISGLTSGATYYYRAYATNSVGGIVYGTEYSIVVPSPPTVPSTTAATSIGQTTATTGGNISSDGGQSLTVAGVCYGTTSNPTTANSKVTTALVTGVFTSNLTGLTASTLYYVRAYAANYFAITYATQISFTTASAAVAPTVGSTTAITSITQTTASSGGTITSDGGSAITAKGICWSTSSGPVATGSHTSDGTGTSTFTSAITGLTGNTLYYVRAYVTNGVTTSYGNQVTFTSGPVGPTVGTTVAVNTIGQTTASSGGSTITDGGSAITAKGVCWSTSSGPVATGSHTSDGTGTSTFTSAITGLTGNTLYYVRAYVTNGVTTSYGNQVTFTSGPVGPTVGTTVAVNTIGQTTASSGGAITSDGGSSITAKGVCWSTSSGPTIANSKTSDGTGTTSFTSNLTGLTAGTLYYVRCYATNGVTTNYGTEVSFTTSSAAITLNIVASMVNQTSTQTIINWFANLSSVAPANTVFNLTVTNVSGSGTHSVAVNIYAGQQTNISLETDMYARLVGSNYTATCVLSSTPSGYTPGTTGAYIIPKQ